MHNQVLPKLRQMLGPAFTAEEGKRVLDLYGDPNSTPAERSAALNALLYSTEEEVKRIQAEQDILLGKKPAQDKPQPQENTPKSSTDKKVVRFDAEGNML